MSRGTIFNITIIPINDQEFRFLVEQPRIELVQGYIANITPDVLHTEDADTPPEGIVYQVGEEIP